MGKKKKSTTKKGHVADYFISENGVGYMPSSEIVKTDGFKRQLEASQKMQERLKK